MRPGKALQGVTGHCAAFKANKKLLQFLQKKKKVTYLWSFFTCALPWWASEEPYKLRSLKQDCVALNLTQHGSGGPAVSPNLQV